MKTTESGPLAGVEGRLGVVGLGANLGDRLATMRAAAARIADILVVRAYSSVYETVPVGKTDQPLFLNAAIAVELTCSPMALLESLLAIEKELGRSRSAEPERWGPRLIDLDVLWIDGVVLDDACLVVPHPRLTERAFALAPLLDVAPGAVDPRTHLPYALASDHGITRTELTLERKVGSG